SAAKCRSTSIGSTALSFSTARADNSASERPTAAHSSAAHTALPGNCINVAELPPCFGPWPGLHGSGHRP
ncbi:hypothetical protein ACPXAO_24110, partial [Salmonella enterica]|uniref:hypothetical protein n=1 Tax=Salmonella enterica TaxID=28901 RepID=UPI003CEC7C63